MPGGEKNTALENDDVVDKFFLVVFDVESKRQQRRGVAAIMTNTTSNCSRVERCRSEPHGGHAHPPTCDTSAGAGGVVTIGAGGAAGAVAAMDCCHRLPAFA